MKKLVLPGLCLCSLLIFFSAGCKTSPKDAPAAAAEPVETTAVPESGDLKAVNQKLIEEAAAARKKAVDAGADVFFPDELTVVDIASREAQAVYADGGDPAEFNQKISDIIYQYKALEQAALAAATRKKITELNFAGYAKSEYDAAEKGFRKTEEMFKSGTAGKDLFEQASKTAAEYASVLNAGYKVLAAKEREKVIALKGKADGIKAAVADKNGYANAVAFFTRAEQEFQAGENEKAYNNFVACYNMLDKVYQDVVKKRAAAEEAMSRAKRRVEESDAAAVKADGIAPVEKVEALGSVETESAQEAQ